MGTNGDEAILWAMLFIREVSAGSNQEHHVCARAMHVRKCWRGCW